MTATPAGPDPRTDAARLTEVLVRMDWGTQEAEQITEALLSVVRQIAAEEVRTVRQWLLETGRADADTLQQLRARVDQIAEESA